MTELYKYKITSYIDSKKYEEKNEKIQLLRNKEKIQLRLILFLVMMPVFLLPILKYIFMKK